MSHMPAITQPAALTALTAVSVDGITMTGNGTPASPLVSTATPVGYITAEQYGATGDGSTNDLTALKNAVAAASALGGLAALKLGPKTYIAGRDGANSWSLDLPSNFTLWGQKGLTWIKHPVGMPNASVAVVRIDGKTNVTIRDVGIDGNWGNAATRVTSASHDVALPAATINVADTTGFPASGSFTLVGSSAYQTIAYTGKTSTTFTGCTGGTGALATDMAVGYVDANTGINHTAQVDPKNYGIMLRGARNVFIENVQIQQVYGDGIWMGFSATDSTLYTRDVKLYGVNVYMAARNGFTVGQRTEDVTLRDCRTDFIYAQAFDTEPVGTTQPARTVLLDHCHLDGWWNPGNASRSINSPLSIVGGSAAAPGQPNFARGYRVRDCTIKGSIIIGDACDVTIESCRIITDWNGNSFAPVYVDHLAEDVRIIGNYIYDRTSTGSGGHDASIVVQRYGSSALTLQPSSVRVADNHIHCRNGVSGISVVGTGGGAWGITPTLAAQETGTASASTSTTATDGTKTWTANQWQGFQFIMGGCVGLVSANGVTGVTVASWTTPLGAPTPTPPAGPYTIQAITGVVELENNTIDCGADGNPAGAYGIVLNASQPGMRIRAHRNTIKNANNRGVYVRNDNSQAFTALELTDNRAWDDQASPTCLSTIFFATPVAPTTPYTPARMVLRGNTFGQGVAAAIVGLTSGTWIVNDGIAAEWAGYGVPNGLVAADVGATYRRLDGGVGRTLWVKEAHSGLSTGWARLDRPAAPAWTVDDGSGIACPANGTEWQALIDACGLTGIVLVPSALYLCQEASGNLADTLATFTLTAAGAGLSYQQAVGGWSRKGVKTTENQNGRWDNSDAGLPDLGAADLTMFAFGIIDTNINVNRMLLGGGTTTFAYVGGATATRAVSGANSATATGTQFGAVRPYGFKHEKGATRFTGYDDVNKLSPTFSASVTGKRITLGGQNGGTAPPTSRIVYAWAWFSAVSDANIKTILQRMGWSIDWT